MRLFVGVDLPTELTSAVAALQTRFEGVSGLRFVDPDGAHLTLKFLGEVEGERLPALEDELASAINESGVAPFEVGFEGLGVFPDLGDPRVLWLGVSEGREKLAMLHESIEERTTAMGFKPATHDFTPHVTLARVGRAGAEKGVEKAIREREPEPAIGSARVSEVRLTESTPGSYDTVRSFELE